MFGRKVAFWGAVVGASILGQFGIELAARKLPIPGLKSFVEFIHCGPGKDVQ